MAKLYVVTRNRNYGYYTFTPVDSKDEGNKLIRKIKRRKGVISSILVDDYRRFI